MVDFPWLSIPTVAGSPYQLERLQMIWFLGPNCWVLRCCKSSHAFWLLNVANWTLTGFNRVHHGTSWYIFLRQVSKIDNEWICLIVFKNVQIGSLPLFIATKWWANIGEMRFLNQDMLTQLTPPYFSDQPILLFNLNPISVQRWVQFQDIDPSFSLSFRGRISNVQTYLE